MDRVLVMVYLRGVLSKGGIWDVCLIEGFRGWFVGRRTGRKFWGN